MPYWKTVAISIGLCGLLLIVAPLIFAALQVDRGKATGIGFVRQELLEFVIRSIVLGWLFGTTWYLLRK